MDKPPPKHRSKSLEDVVLKTIEKNNRVIWIAIVLLAVLVAYAMNRG